MMFRRNSSSVPRITLEEISGVFSERTSGGTFKDILHKLLNQIPGEALEDVRGATPAGISRETPNEIIERTLKVNLGGISN